jgi:hypothetical protein
MDDWRHKPIVWSDKSGRDRLVTFLSDRLRTLTGLQRLELADSSLQWTWLLTGLRSRSLVHFSSSLRGSWPKPLPNPAGLLSLSLFVDIDRASAMMEAVQEMTRTCPRLEHIQLK